MFRGQDEDLTQSEITLEEEEKEEMVQIESQSVPIGAATKKRLDYREFHFEPIEKALTMEFII